MYDVITIGSATRDVFQMSKALHIHKAPDVLAHIEACLPFGAKINVEQIHFDTGGGATNNAVTFSRLGKLKTAALMRVGNDIAGREIIRVLKNERIGTDFVQITNEDQTAYSTILSPGGEVGERTIFVYRGASQKIEHGKIPWQRLKTKWFCVSSLGGDLVLLKKIIDQAKKIGAKIAFNPGGQELKMGGKIKSLLNQIDYLIVNREEASKLTGEKFENIKGLLRALVKINPVAVMTDGPKGAYAVIQNQLNAKRYTLNAYVVPSVGHKPKNLTGAGDAFGSGFVTGMIKSEGNMEEALAVAAINADSVVQHVGAKIGILKSYPSAAAMKKVGVKVIKI